MQLQPANRKLTPDDTSGPSPADDARRLALFYGSLFVIYGVHVPFFPVWLHWRGLSPGEISIIMAAPYFVRLFVTPTVALSADRRGAHRAYLVMLAWTSLAIVLTLAFQSSFWPILALAVALIVANSTMMPLIETIAVAGVRNSGFDYGRIRLWGSLTFIAASFLGGFIVDHQGGGAGIWLIAGGVAMTIAAAYLLPTLSVPSERQSAGASQSTSTPAPLALLRHPAFIAFLVAAGATQAAHATFLGFGTLIWQSQGIDSMMAGILWSIGVLAEVAVFAFAGSHLKHVAPARLLIFGSAVSVLRWIAMGFAPPLATQAALQLLHGITFGLTHIAAIRFLHDAVPHEIGGSAQAYYATVASGVAMGAATLIAGQIFAAAGAVSYFAMAGIALVGFIASLLLARIWHGAHIV